MRRVARRLRSTALAAPFALALAGGGFSHASVLLSHDAQDFVLARAAAEVCRNVRLSEEQERQFVRSVAWRDPERRSLEELKPIVEEALTEAHAVVRSSGCDSRSIVLALADWDFRVSVLVAPRSGYS